MITWKAAYARCRESEQFRSYFGRKGRLPKEADFDLRAFVLAFENVDGAEQPGTPGPVNGPLTQEFEYGAIILGVTSGCYLAQQAVGVASYAPSRNTGKRDLFVLFFEYTSGEQITQPQPLITPTTFVADSEARVQGEALMGNGESDTFPNEILISPSNSIDCKVAALIAAGYEETLPTLCIHVVFHAMVPKTDWVQQ